MPELCARPRACQPRARQRRASLALTATEPGFRRTRAGPLTRLFLRAPRLLYQVGPIAELLRSRCVLLLTTRGRRTGRLRTTAVSFMPVEDHFVIFSGWGVSSAWYHNVRADPNVHIRVGRRSSWARAELVQDPGRRKELMLLMARRSGDCGPPRAVRRLLKLTHAFDYDAEIAMAVAAGGDLPVIELFPLPGQQ